jgi:hypothetical protein
MELVGQDKQNIQKQSGKIEKRRVRSSGVKPQLTTAYMQ